MTYQTAYDFDEQENPLELSSWVSAKCEETPEAVAFQSGAALTVLDRLLTNQVFGVPVRLLANRLALKAATATSKMEGRLTSETDIRDAYHLTPAGEARGPDGDLLAYWREAARLQLAGAKWQVQLANLVSPELEIMVQGLLQDGEKQARARGPIAASVSVMRAILDRDDRAERYACLFSDVVLARALKWDGVLPVTAGRITKGMLRDLIAQRHGADTAIQAQILESIVTTVHLTQDLAHRGAALRGIAPKLRAKGSQAAVNLFLSEDAVAPSTMLSPIIHGSSVAMTDRAARRLCDRLVALGVAQELTGRSTFRLYGIAP